MPVPMTALPPDPDPAQTPGLEPGGGVPPGSTPPDSAQTSAAAAPAEPGPRRKITPTAVAALIALAIFVLLFAATAVLLVADM